jgi:hypothetical protein
VVGVHGGMTWALALCLGMSCRTAPNRKKKRLLWIIATIPAAAAALASCSNRDCAYYGDTDASTRCVVVGPSLIDGEQ